jgi:hypothetical protein
MREGGRSLSRIVLASVLAFVSVCAGAAGLTPASIAKSSAVASHPPPKQRPGAGLLRSSLETTPSGRLFSPSSVWNRVVPARAKLAPNSRGVTGYLDAFVKSSLTEGIGPWINTTDYSTPIYTVPSNQPTVPVQFSYSTPALNQAFEAVPIPRGAQPAAGTDAQMTIYQPSTNTLWELWEMHRATSGGWVAGWGGRMVDVSSSPGYYQNVVAFNRTTLEQNNWGATASGLPLAAGLITLDDLATGHINHALALLVPKAKAKVFYCPAQRTDGYDTSRNAIPEGAHFRLDPRLNLSKLAMPPVTRMIAEAAQKYGLIVNDQTGATVGFRAQDPTPLMRAGLPNPYGKYFENPASGQYQMPTQFLASFPWSHLQLLAPPTSC